MNYFKLQLKRTFPIDLKKICAQKKYFFTRWKVNESKILIRTSFIATGWTFLSSCDLLEMVTIPESDRNNIERDGITGSGKVYKFLRGKNFETKRKRDQISKRRKLV